MKKLIKLVVVLFMLVHIAYGQNLKPEPHSFNLDFKKVSGEVLNAGKLSTGESFQAQAISKGTKITLPDPSGKMIEFWALEIDILSENLKKEYQCNKRLN